MRVIECMRFTRTYSEKRSFESIMEKKTIIIKVGNQIVLTDRNRIDEFRMAHILDQVQLLWEKGFGIVLIVSGAVALGSQVIDIKDDQFSRQIAAGIGQVRLISTMSKICVQKKIEIAQILLTPEIFDKKDRQDILKQMFTFYFQNKILPVVNENDTIHLNCFGGNDYVALHIARLLHADHLVMLSGFQKSKFAIGGAKSKIEVQQRLKSIHIHSIIIDGKARDCIVKNI